MRNLDEYISLKDLVADCGGIEKFRFFGHLNKYTIMTPFGFALSEDSDDWVECKIEDDTSAGDLYTLEHGYKVNIIPVSDNRYAGHRFYQSDLLSMLKSGCFILKTAKGQHIEEREGYEHLCGDVYLHHHWSEVVEQGEKVNERKYYSARFGRIQSQNERDVPESRN